MGDLGERVTGLVPNHVVIVTLPKPCSSNFTHMLALARHPGQLDLVLVSS